MGCTSSTEHVIDPATGLEKKKKKLGGAYPGHRRPQHQPYAPTASQFGNDGQAVAHFVAHGGGNALTLVKQDGTHQPETGKPQSEFIQVTLPDGVQAGQTIHVQAPDGRLNAIVIPPGFGPGSTFTVEFAPEEKAVTAAPAVAAAPAFTTAPIAHGDDGFATGFNNPNYTPPPQAAAASATVVSVSEPEANAAYEANIDLTSYPTTTATPIYSNPPQYPNK